MGYLFLCAALFSGLVKAYCGKKLGNFASGTRSAVLLNFLRMLLCILFGLIFLFVSGDAEALTLSPLLLFISALSGIGTSFFVVTWLLSVRKNAYMLVEVFLMLGTLFPMITGVFLFGEEISPKQWLGFALLILASYIMCSYQKSIQIKLTGGAVLLLIACGLANGATDFSQKLFTKSFPELPVSVFNFYTYLFAALTLALCFLFLPKKDALSFGRKDLGRSVLLVSVMALALTANTFFKTTAAFFLDSAKLYPLNQGAALILSTLMASFLFKEKFTFRALLGILLSFTALMIMNL